MFILIVLLNLLVRLLIISDTGSSYVMARSPESNDYLKTLIGYLFR